MRRKNYNQSAVMMHTYAISPVGSRHVESRIQEEGEVRWARRINTEREYRESQDGTGMKFGNVPRGLAKQVGCKPGLRIGKPGYIRQWWAIAVDAATRNPCLVHSSGDRWVAPVGGIEGVDWCREMQEIVSEFPEYASTKTIESEIS